jgi:hypothetical protein
MVSATITVSLNKRLRMAIKLSSQTTGYPRATLGRSSALMSPTQSDSEALSLNMVWVLASPTGRAVKLSWLLHMTHLFLDSTPITPTDSACGDPNQAMSLTSKNSMMDNMTSPSWRDKELSTSHPFCIPMIAPGRASNYASSSNTSSAVLLSKISLSASS